MTKKAGRPIIWPFWLELTLTAIIPFVIWWTNTPTSILNSGVFWKWLEFVGMWGSAIVLFAGIPAGIIGIRAVKRMTKLRTAAIVLSIINLIAGIIEVGTIILVFCAVVFGGISV